MRYPSKRRPQTEKQVEEPPVGMGVRRLAVDDAHGPAALSVHISNGESARLSLEGLRVLIVEDDDDARELVSLVLHGAGALVSGAASAADGFHLIHESHPQLLVSDIGMPDEDGYSLMRRIRALQCCDGGDIPSIALSAFTRPEDRMLALRAGFTLHIAKPVHPSHLLSAVVTVAALIGHRGRPQLAP